MSYPENIFGLSSLLVDKVSKTLSSAEPVLYLSITQDFWWRHDVYSRVYLRYVEDDGTEIFYVSTDEPPNGNFELPKRNLGEINITALNGFEEFLEDLLNNSFPSFYRETIHEPPVYVQYDIGMVSEQMKPRLLKHLMDEVSGYSKDYLDAHFGEKERNRIKLWQQWLTANPTKTEG